MLKLTMKTVYDKYSCYSEVKFYCQIDQRSLARHENIKCSSVMWCFIVILFQKITLDTNNKMQRSSNMNK